MVQVVQDPLEVFDVEVVQVSVSGYDDMPREDGIVLDDTRYSGQEGQVLSVEATCAGKCDAQRRVLITSARTLIQPLSRGRGQEP